MKTLPYIAAAAFLAAILNVGLFSPWEWLTFSGMISLLWIVHRISTFNEKNKAHYRRAYWRRYQYNKNDEKV